MNSPISIEIPADWSAAPLAVMSGSKALVVRDDRMRAEMIRSTVLRGGLDGPRGLGELVRWSARLIVRGTAEGATDAEVVSARAWLARLGDVVPHVTTDAQDRVTAVAYKTLPDSATMPQGDEETTMDLERLDDVLLLLSRGCDPVQLCDRPGRPVSGVTLADVRDEFRRRLGGRALREALARLDASEADDRAWQRAQAIRGMR